MHRMMMGGRGNRQSFAARVLAAFTTGEVDPEDVAVIAVAVGIGMTAGALIGAVGVSVIGSIVSTQVGGL